MRIIGDVHGKIKKYKRIIEDPSYSVQLGDMGFKKEYKRLDHSEDSRNHRFIMGNHDDYDNIPEASLGDFGYSCLLGGMTFFFARGAESVDKRYRTSGVDWWDKEEMDIPTGQKALYLYEKTMPTVMLTHDCPLEILSYFVTNSAKERGSRTNQLLQRMFEIHQPMVWFFGHHHQTRSFHLKGTMFQCLDELDYVDLSQTLNGFHYVGPNTGSIYI